MKYLLRITLLTLISLVQTLAQQTICPLKLSQADLESLKTGQKMNVGRVTLQITGQILGELLSNPQNRKMQAGLVDSQIIKNKPETELCKYKLGVEKRLIPLTAIVADMPTTPQTTSQTKKLATKAQNQSTTAQNPAKTGTLMFQRDQNKNIKSYQFTALHAGERGEPYEATALKKILFVKGADGTLYLWTDPREDSRQATLDLMNKVDVVFTDDLEGMHVEFKLTGNKVNLKEDNKDYELVDILSVSRPKPPPRPLPRRTGANRNVEKH